MIVDTDAVLPSSVTLEYFQAIAGRYAQRVQRRRSVQQVQLPVRGLVYSRIKSTDCPESDMSKWIPILVRSDYVQDVMALVIKLESAFSEDTEGDEHALPTAMPRDARPSPVTINEVLQPHQTWSLEDLKQLALGSTETTRRWTLAMDACAAHPGEFFPTSEIAARTGMSIAEWRDAPRKISRHLKAHYPSVPLSPEGFHIWPLVAQTRPEYPNEVSWSMTPEMSELWKQARS